MIKQSFLLSLLLVNFVLGDPVITGLSPETMPATGGTLTIAGTDLYIDNGFLPDFAPTVTLDGQRLTVSDSSTSTQLRVIVPSGTGTNLPLVVTFQGASDETTLSYSAPVITEITGSPTTAGGQILQIVGSNFGSFSIENELRIAGQIVQTFSWSNTSIWFAAPAAAGTVSMQVTVGGQTSNSFEYDYPNPVIDNFSVDSLPTQGGAEVTVTGSNLSAAPVFVLSGLNLDQTVDSYDVNSSHTEAKFTLPEGEGSGTFQARIGEILSNGLSFSYDPPEIVSMTPSNGLAILAETVTLSGKNFGRSPQLTFDGAPIAISESSHSSVTFTRPISSAGQFLVAISVAGQTSNSIFFITLSSPPGSYIDLDSGEVLLAPPGTYAPDSNMTAPIEVPAGFYSPVAGLPVPIPAPSGTWAPIPGSTEVMMVPPGFTVDSEFPQLLNALPATTIQSFEIKENGQHEISFSTQNLQNYGIFFTTDLVNYVLVTTVQGLGTDVTRSLTKPVNSEKRGFWIVAPRASQE